MSQKKGKAMQNLPDFREIFPGISAEPAAPVVQALEAAAGHGPLDEGTIGLFLIVSRMGGLPEFYAFMFFEGPPTAAEVSKFAALNHERFGPDLIVIDMLARFHNAEQVMRRAEEIKGNLHNVNVVPYPVRLDLVRPTDDKGGGGERQAHPADGEDAGQGGEGKLAHGKGS